MFTNGNVDFTNGTIPRTERAAPLLTPASFAVQLPE